MTALLPDFALLCCCAVRGFARVTREHLAAALALELPVVVVITKVGAACAAWCVRCWRHIGGCCVRWIGASLRSVGTGALRVPLDSCEHLAACPQPQLFPSACVGQARLVTPSADAGHPHTRQRFQLKNASFN